MDKQSRMADIRARVSAHCPKPCEEGSRPVWGEGPLDAEIAIVGEAPGAEEAAAGRPFVGEAGRFFDTEMARAGLERPSTYITNVVKCRPTREGARGPVNRSPSAAEVKEWTGTLLAELEVVSPRVVVCLGSAAASAVIGPDFQRASDRGRWFDDNGIWRAIATYHPAYVIRYKNIDTKGRLSEFRSDLEAAKSQLYELVH